MYGNRFHVEDLPDCIFEEPTLVVGDLNARHPALGTQGRKNRNGDRLLQLLMDHPDVSVLGSSEPTHVEGGRLDYACIFNGEGLSGGCQVLSELLSDHWPLLVDLPLGKKPTSFRRQRFSLKPEETGKFIKHVSDWWRGGYQPTDLDSFYEDLLEVIAQGLGPEDKGRKKVQGSRKQIYNNDREVKAWRETLRAARKCWLRERTDESRNNMLDVVGALRLARQRARDRHWQQFAENIKKSRNLGDIWREVNKVRGNRPRFVAHPNPEGEANNLAEQWAAAASMESLPRDVREELSSGFDYRDEFVEARKASIAPSCTSISQNELLHAISGGQSTAPGADGVTYEILNCIASIPNGPLLALFNMSYEMGRLPKGWKKAIVIPIPKGNGKFRPISLMSCFCKMLERIILHRLQYQVGDGLSSNLYGFIRGKGTSDSIIHCISANGITCRAFIDLQGAFDKISGDVVLYELAGIGVEGKLLTWVADYLRDRSAQVWYQGFLSNEYRLELGSPQGGPLSPFFFNVVMNRVARELYPDGVHAIIYADDILLQGQTTVGLQAALDTLGDTCRSLGLVINREKKVQSKVRGVSLSLEGQELERVDVYKYLGVYVGFGKQFKDAEVDYLLTLCRARLQPMRALAASGVGVGPEILRMMYISTVRSLIDYAAPILTQIGNGRTKKLEVLQNTAMRAITSSLKTTVIATLRLELHLLSISDRIRETSMVSAIRHIRGGGSILAQQVHAATEDPRGCKVPYVRILAKHLGDYGVLGECVVLPRVDMLAPWDRVTINVDVTQPEGKKSLCNPMELCAMYRSRIANCWTEGCIHMYCDGSVDQDGKAGYGLLLRDPGVDGS